MRMELNLRANEFDWGNRRLVLPTALFRFFLLDPDLAPDSRPCCVLESPSFICHLEPWFLLDISFHHQNLDHIEQFLPFSELPLLVVICGYLTPHHLRWWWCCFRRSLATTLPRIAKQAWQTLIVLWPASACKVSLTKLWFFFGLRYWVIVPFWLTTFTWTRLQVLGLNFQFFIGD